MTEIEEKIVELRKQGYYLNEISDMVSLSYNIVRKKDTELMKQGYLTEEDIIKGKDERKRREYKSNPKIQRIFKLKLEGKSDIEVSEIMGIKSRQEVSRYVKEGKRLGLIDEKEIARAVQGKKEKEKENNTDRKRIIKGLRKGELYSQIAEETTVGDAQVKNITTSLIEEGVISQEEIDKAREKSNNAKDSDRKRVLEGLRKGKQDAQIAKDTTVGYHQVRNIKISLIEEGVISQEEIDKARKENKNETMPEENEKEEIIVDKEKLLSYLILGYDTRTIKKKMKLKDEPYRGAVEELIKEGRITKKEIREYRELREKQDKKKVLEALKIGKSQREIAEEIDCTLSKTQGYIERIKKEENITDQDIIAWKNQREDSLEKRKEVVLKGLQNGLTSKEIVLKYPKQKMEEYNVKSYRSILIKEGKITEQEIEIARNKRKQEENEQEKNLTDNEKSIYQYLIGGYEINEIIDITKKTEPAIRGAIARIKKKGKITQKEIEEARQQREEEKQREELRRKNWERMQKFNQLKREIEIEVKFNKNISAEKEKKIGEYIDLCYEIYKEEKIPNTELIFLSQAIYKIPIDERKIIKFTRICINVGEYKEALNMVRSIYENNLEENSTYKQKELEMTLDKACKVQQATQIMKKGNTNIAVVSNVTGLSKEEVCILKIKMQGKPIKILNISRRRQILEELMLDKDSDKIQEEIGITDFEMEDIKSQALEYRQYKGKRKNAKPEEQKELDKQVEQDIKVRIIVLLTKLGKKPEYIAKIVKTEPEIVEANIKHALEQGGLIKQEELNGINPLACYQNLRNEQRVL